MKLQLLTLCFFYQSLQISDAQDVYQIGVGIADVTGPAAEVGMVSFKNKCARSMIFVTCFL